MAGLTKPTFNSGAGFTFNTVANYLKRKCRFYIAVDDLTTAITDPADSDELNALYATGVNQKYVPLGDMDADIGASEPKQATEDRDFGKILGDWDIPLVLNSLVMTPEMLEFMDSDEAKGLLSVLVVPDGNETADEAVYIAYRRMTLAFEPSFQFGGKTSKNKLTFSRSAAKLTDCIRYALLEAPVGP